MHDIWNPWHGCVKYSEGCQNCYMYFLDAQRGLDGSKIYRVKGNFNYPLQKNRQKEYKVKSGEMIRVCLTSDFFLEEADEWRDEVWDIIAQRPDVKFSILTKRANRIKDHLPFDWGDGWENVELNVTTETQLRADERIPVLLDIPAKHRGIVVAPCIAPISIQKYLETQLIDDVCCGGENYDGCRPCNFEWVKQLRKECVETNTTFIFMETGTKFIKDGKLYTMPSKKVQSEMAYKSGMNYIGRPIYYKLTNTLGEEMPKEELHQPQYTSIYCDKCASKPTFDTPHA